MLTWMKFIKNVAVLLSITMVLFMVSCKQSTNNDKYFYNYLRDTIPPKISISVPLNNSYYQFAEDIHIIGNVLDLEVTDKAGKLKSLNLSLYQYDPVNDTIVNLIKQFNPDVDGKDGYTFNEVYTKLNGSGVTYCKLIVTATDYSTRIDQDSIFLSIGP